jgi:NAD-dependent dihydropyrimidine dehydrogenase PreA subunit
MVKEYERCLFCKDENCTKACPKGGTPAKFIRSLYFGNVTDIHADCGCHLCRLVCPVNAISVSKRVEKSSTFFAVKPCKYAN